MVRHGGSSAGSYLADPTSPIPSHCASVVTTSTLRVNSSHIQHMKVVNLREVHHTCLPHVTFKRETLHVPPGCFWVACNIYPQDTKHKPLSQDAWKKSILDLLKDFGGCGWLETIGHVYQSLWTWWIVWHSSSGPELHLPWCSVFSPSSSRY